MATDASIPQAATERVGRYRWVIVAAGGLVVVGAALQALARQRNHDRSTETLA